jgi:predicted ATPase
MIREGIDLNSSRNNALNAAFYSSLLTRAYTRAGRLNDGLQVLDQAVARVEQSGERFYEAELFRLKGELLQSSNADAAGIKACLYKAIEVARSQSAKSLELRAVMSLGRLLAKQGQRQEARVMLADIYGRFSEGFDAADLMDAKTLLDELNA